MGELKYTALTKGKICHKSEIYKVENKYLDYKLKNYFINLRSNVADLNNAVVAKAITGNEQDFIMLMSRAKEFILSSGITKEKDVATLLSLFQECIFGYYVLTPLINTPEVSDIKVHAWNYITCKARGRRYVTNLSFESEDDYNKWFDRIIRIHKFSRDEKELLQTRSDRKSSEDFYLRVDIEKSNVVSTEANNIHIRKTPKTKYGWDYLVEQGLVDEEIIEYIKDRIAAGYSFLISGQGGSGKTTLLNGIIDILPYNESVLVSQESDELYSDSHPQIQFEHTVASAISDNGVDISLEDELRMGLLQDIDTFIIGEIKGGEALYVFTTAMSTGARFLGTIHSNDAIGSVDRLAHCARYISDYTVDSLEKMLESTPLSLIHLSNFSVDEIVEVNGWSDEYRRLNYQRVYKKELP